MKKLLLFGAAAVMLAAASCSKNAASGDLANPKGLSDFSDSLAYYSGTVQGLDLGANISRMLPPEIMANFDKDKFLAGMKTVLDVDTANQSYILGMSYALQLKQQFMSQAQMGVDTNVDKYFKAFSTAFKTDSLADSVNASIYAHAQLLMGKAQTIMMQRQQELQAAQVKAMEEKALANDTRGKQYVDSLKATDKDIITTESGLSYKVVTMGKGAVATKDSKEPVPVKYVGKHIDGTSFDSSDGQIVKFPVNGVVRGFSEALTTFPAGTTVVLYMPADLAYGTQGNQAIEPGETLIFELEICEAEPAAAPADNK